MWHCRLVVSGVWQAAPPTSWSPPVWAAASPSYKQILVPAAMCRLLGELTAQAQPPLL